ncbi:hypothetical protein D3C72_1138800 [compost metagenome]
MSDERRAPSPSEEAFTEDLVRLDAELATRSQTNAFELTPEASRTLLSGLLAGMTFVGRPREMHATAERLAHQATQRAR